MVSYLMSMMSLWRQAYPQEAQRQFNMLLDFAIDGCYSKVIKRMVRRTNPENVEALMTAATNSVTV